MAQKRSSASEMLSGLKSRLGFAHPDDEREEYSDYDDDVDDYDSFEDDYDEYDEFDEDLSARSSSRGSKFGRPDSTPQLVSIEDVREHNKVTINSSRGSYESAHRDRNGVGVSATSAYIPATGSPTNRYTSTYQRNSRDRELVEGNRPAVSSPTYQANERNASRSEGFNSLFQPSSSSATSSNSNNPSFSAYSPSSSLGGMRKLTVLQPRVYNDVEGVTRALKSGNVVVLAMGVTPDDLYKRILDFSFGVASALDAHVDSLGNKVYALVIGSELNEDELQQLRNQGVL